MELDAEQTQPVEGGILPFLAVAAARKGVMMAARKGAQYATKRALRKKMLKKGLQRGMEGSRKKSGKFKKKGQQFWKKHKIADAVAAVADVADAADAAEMASDFMPEALNDEQYLSDEQAINEPTYDTDYESIGGNINEENKFINDYNKMQVFVDTKTEKIKDEMKISGGGEDQNVVLVEQNEVENIKEEVANITDKLQDDIKFKRAVIEDNINKYGVELTKDVGPSLVTADVVLKTVGGLAKVNNWIIVLMVTSAIILLYITHILCKPSLTGHWFLHGMGHVAISHNRFMDKCKIIVNNLETEGLLRKNRLYILTAPDMGYKPFGTWDYKDVIYIDVSEVNLRITDSSKLTRVK